MELSDVQNPYDPSGWTGRVELLEYDPVTLSTSVSIPICPTDPSRLWLLLAASVTANSWVIWPSQQTGLYGIRPDASTGYILIHSASYPGAVQSQWYGFASAPGVVLQVLAGRVIQ